MTTDQERQAIVDAEHLRLLPVFYWIMGGLSIFLSLYGLIYVAVGVLFALLPWDATGPASEAPPAFMGWFFVLFGALFILAIGSFAAAQILAGVWIRKRKHRTACLVIAGFTCLSVPFGTALGVLTFIVLLRPSVTPLFAIGSPSAQQMISATGQYPAQDSEPPAT